MKTFIAIILMTLAINSYSQEDTFCPTYDYTGFIEKGVNQRQGIRINFTILSDSILIGSYLDKSTNTSVKLVGHLNDDNSFSMIEKDKDENITGLLKGRLSVDNYSAAGQWTSPLNDHVFGMEFIKTLEITPENIINKNKEYFKYNDLKLAIKEYSQVKNIQVEKHGYKVLPRKLARLSSIESINLAENKFQMFPLVLFKLSTLDEISLNNNRIKYISSSIANLKNLKLLKLNNNKLEYVPIEIGSLSNLIYLDLSNNKLSLLPVEIKNLLNLQELHLEGNNFSQVERDKLMGILPNCKIFF